MKRLRLAAVLTGLGAFVLCPVARALVPPDPVSQPSAEVPSASGLGLLERAAAAARSRAWTGTQRVTSLVSGIPVVTQTGVEHDPSHDVLDERLLGVLDANYDLAVGAPDTCNGHRAQVVEARRAGVAGAAAVAARFWVDTATGVLLRRDVMDLNGSLVRRTEIVGMKPMTSPVEAGYVVPHPAGEHLDRVALLDMAQAGWTVPQGLPSQFVLYDARWIDGEVLELAYSDGLSTLSLFVQQGEVTPRGTGVVRRVGDGSVWEALGDPERAVWVADGRTWTLVSEADPSTVDAVLVALPHEHRQVSQDDLGDRVWRGMSRVGAWLNPFD